MKKKTTFTCQNVDQFSTLYERLLKTYKLRVKDWYSVAFPAGHTGLTNDQIKDNLKESIQFISGKFKKGAANIKHCFIKRAHGETVKLY
ncbi:RL1 [Hepatospora eriocheir]|nr:RL1 [Hepatospora eriocheir]